MELVTRIAFPLLIVAIGLGLTAWHVSAWRRAKVEDADDALERDFQWRRFRRRVQTSGMVALIGVLLGVVLMVDARRHPALIGWLLMASLLLLGWIMLLAAADLISTRSHVTQMKHHHLIETAKLQAALRRAKEQLREAEEEGSQNGDA